jgi:uncharacterized protein (UPF0332 family)
LTVPAAARAHLAKAEEFLTAAELAHEEGLTNAATSDAVTSGINAKGAICLALTGVTNKSDDHTGAVAELDQAGRAGQRLAPTLSRLLKLKSKSQYQTISIASGDSAKAVVWAATLVRGAREVLAAGGT